MLASGSDCHSIYCECEVQRHFRADKAGVTYPLIRQGRRKLFERKTGNERLILFYVFIRERKRSDCTNERLEMTEEWRQAWASLSQKFHVFPCGHPSRTRVPHGTYAISPVQMPAFALNWWLTNTRRNPKQGTRGTRKGFDPVSACTLWLAIERAAASTGQICIGVVCVCVCIINVCVWRGGKASPWAPG